MLKKEQINESARRGELYLSSRLTIDTVEELRSVLLDMGRENPQVAINGEAIEAIDVFGLQLLCSACREFIRDNRQLVWKNNIPPVIKTTMKQMGFSRESGCMLCPEHVDCLWLS